MVLQVWKNWSYSGIGNRRFETPYPTLSIWSNCKIRWVQWQRFKPIFEEFFICIQLIHLYYFFPQKSLFKECVQLGLAISAGSLLFCKYFSRLQKCWKHGSNKIEVCNFTYLLRSTMECKLGLAKRSFWQKEGLLQQTMTLLQGPKDPFLPTLV